MKRLAPLAVLILLAGCASAELEKQKKEIDELNTKAGAMLSQLKDKTDEAEALKAAKAELEAKVTDLEGKLAVSNGRLDSLSKSNGDLSSALKAGKDALASKLNDAIAEKDDAAKKLADALREKLALERLKNIYKSAKDKAAADLEALQKERERLTAKLGVADAAAKREADSVVQAEGLRSAARAKTREEMGLAADAVLKELQAGKAGVDQDGEAFSVTLSDDLLFDEGAAKLSDGGMARLDRLAKALKALGGKKVRVEAHSDNSPFKKDLIGGYAGHWELTAARATAVARWLHEHGGLDPAALETAGYGEFRPVKPNATAAGRAANRRVVLVVSPR